MRIIAVPCLAADLRPGDLFSSVGPEYWDRAHLGEGPDGPAVGIKCYIRTQAQPKVMAANLEQIYRLHIISDELERAVPIEVWRQIATEDVNDPIEAGGPDDKDDLEHE